MLIQWSRKALMYDVARVLIALPCWRFMDSETFRPASRLGETASRSSSVHAPSARERH
jgi:hypothetical protein